MTAWLKQAFVFLGPLLLVSGSLLASEDATSSLEATASTFWDARVRGDWAAVYPLLAPEDRARMSSEQFVELRKKKGPFHFLSAEIGEVAAANNLAWVEVSYAIQPQGFPQLTPIQRQVWQIWRKRGGQWHPLPKVQHDQVPKLPPHLRSPEEEAILLTRTQEFWKAKEEGDWARLYEYLEPDYRAQVSKEQFLQRRALFSYLSHQLEWAEVNGRQGRVKVIYTHKLNDPSLAKLDPEERSEIEEWVKVDDQWYFRISKSP